MKSAQRILISIIAGLAVFSTVRVCQLEAKITRLEKETILQDIKLWTELIRR